MTERSNPFVRGRIRVFVNVFDRVLLVRFAGSHVSLLGRGRFIECGRRRSDSHVFTSRQFFHLAPFASENTNFHRPPASARLPSNPRFFLFDDPWTGLWTIVRPSFHDYATRNQRGLFAWSLAFPGRINPPRSSIRMTRLLFDGRRSFCVILEAFSRKKREREREGGRGKGVDSKVAGI